jgi:hypothetical protein
MVKKTLPSLDTQAHEFVRRAIAPGSLTVDATAGNGNDALFLAGLVGDAGRVLAFDVQPEALESTGRRLRAAGVRNVVCIHAGHEHIGRYLDEYAPNRPVAAAMFNLGFLPGGDPAIVTRAETTIAACAVLLDRLDTGGLLSVHIYAGHQGGGDETRELLAWAGGLAWEQWYVLRLSSFNKQRNPEHLLMVERRRKRDVRA